MRTEDTLKLLNPWWKEKRVGEELAKPYKRRAFKGLLGLLDKRQVVVVVGLRRVGKTTLLYQAMEHLLGEAEPPRIVYFNFDKDVEELAEVLAAYGRITGVDWKKEKIFVFLDEVSKLNGWSSQIKLFYDAFPNIKFLVSSSSSVGLEKDVARDLAGRHFTIRVRPLDFAEYLDMRGKSGLADNAGLWEDEIKAEAERYLLRTFPEIVGWEDPLLIKDYLRSTIIDRIVKEDLPAKFKNVNTPLLLKLIEIFYTQPGTYLEYDTISKGLGISKKTLYTHISFLEFSYLIRIVRNFRPGIFAESRKLQRVYAYWWSLLYCYTEDRDKIIENMVGNYLNAGHYWRKHGKEIDFLRIEGKKMWPIEVKNKERISKVDINPLAYFLSKYKTKEGMLVYQGKEAKKGVGPATIRLVPVWKFLLENTAQQCFTS
ncbi:MAG: ATP-binding protein [Candidatus Diapherotrites archaeon]|nr:ATP-binding protein [Candidatus Diapherotrites archaeon]